MITINVFPVCFMERLFEEPFATTVKMSRHLTFGVEPSLTQFFLFETINI